MASAGLVYGSILAFRAPDLRGVVAYSSMAQMGLITLGVFAFDDLGLHRLQASIQPANERSIALVRGAGFRREGLSRRYLKIGGRWRDHERWALTLEDWRKKRDRQ